jgi:hypothetical protein
MKAMLGPWFILATGIFSIVCAVANWDWFFNSSRAQPLNKAIGRGGARVLHFGLGVLLTWAGAHLLLDRHIAKTPTSAPRASSPRGE